MGNLFFIEAGNTRGWFKGIFPRDISLSSRFKLSFIEKL